MNNLQHRGDTIIEVMLAMTLLSAILFTSWSIVNRSTQISLTARQRIVMVNQLKEQAEVIKSIYSNPASKGEVTVSRKFGGTTAKAFAQPTNVNSNPCDSTRNGLVTNGKNPTGAFYFDENANVSTTANTAKTVSQYTNAKVWIQMIAGTGYIDFYVRGCWPTSGSKQAEDNSQLIVRLNT